MAVIYDPARIIKKVLVDNGVGLLTSKLEFKDKYRKALLRLDFIGSKDIKDFDRISNKTIDFYKDKMKTLKADGDKAYKKDALNEGKLLSARVTDLLIEKASADIKERYKGEKYMWMPSVSAEPDLEHALNYGKIFVIGEGEQPGEQWGCKCGMEILTDEPVDDTPAIYKLAPPSSKAQRESLQEQGETVVRNARIDAAIAEAKAVSERGDELFKRNREKEAAEKAQALKAQQMAQAAKVLETAETAYQAAIKKAEKAVENALKAADEAAKLGVGKEAIEAQGAVRDVSEIMLQARLVADKALKAAKTAGADIKLIEEAALKLNETLKQIAPKTTAARKAAIAAKRTVKAVKKALTGKISPDHILHKKPEYAPVFDKKGQLKKFSDVKWTDENKKIFFRSLGLSNGKSLNAEQFEWFYNGMKGLTDKIPGLMNASVSGDKAFFGDFVGRVERTRKNNTGGSLNPITKTLSLQSNVSKLKNDYPYNVQIRFAPQNTTMEGIIYHEFDHAITLSATNMAELLQKAAQVRSRVWTVLERDFGVRRGDIKTAKIVIEKELCGYAAYKTSFGNGVSPETSAEAFKAVVSNGRQAGKLAVGIVEEWIKTLSPAEQKIFSPLTK